jgi:inner membrane protein
MHDCLDTCTVYGTGLLTPFSEYRFSWDNIFVADPLYTLPLLIGFMALVVLRNNHPSRYKWNRFGLVVSSVYMLFTFYNHFNATQALTSAMKEKGIRVHAYFAAPTLFNNLLWNVVAQDSVGFWVGYYSVFDGSNKPELNFIPQNNQMLAGWNDNREIKKLKTFSKGFYCVTEAEGKRWFNDLRFGQVGGWENPNAKFAFAFDLSENANNTMVVQKGRIEGSSKYMIKSMWIRIQGR